MKYSQNSYLDPYKEQNLVRLSAPQLSMFFQQSQLPSPKGNSPPNFQSTYISPQNKKHQPNCFSTFKETSPAKFQKDQLKIGKEIEAKDTYFYQRDSQQGEKTGTARSYGIGSMTNYANEIEELMERQNLNLKQQNKYLLNEIRALKKGEREYQKIISNLQKHIKQLEKQNEVYKQQYRQVKTYIVEGMDRMEEIFFQTKEEVSVLEDQKQKTQVTMSQNFSEKIEQLNQKFETSMKQYRITNNPEYRKQSAEIAKQIKQIRLKKEKEKIERIPKVLKQESDENMYQ